MSTYVSSWQGRAPNNNGIEVGSVSRCSIGAWQTFQELKRRDGEFKKLLVDAVIGLLSFTTNKPQQSSILLSLFLGQEQMARLNIIDGFGCRLIKTEIKLFPLISVLLWRVSGRFN
jgi:hypothetical protein